MTMPPSPLHKPSSAASAALPSRDSKGPGQAVKPLPAPLARRPDDKGVGAASVLRPPCGAPPHSDAALKAHSLLKPQVQHIMDGLLGDSVVVLADVMREHLGDGPPAGRAIQAVTQWARCAIASAPGRLQESHLMLLQSLPKWRTENAPGLGDAADAQRDFAKRLLPELEMRAADALDALPEAALTALAERLKDSL